MRVFLPYLDFYAGHGSETMVTEKTVGRKGEVGESKLCRHESEGRERVVSELEADQDTFSPGRDSSASPDKERAGNSHGTSGHVLQKVPLVMPVQSAMGDCHLT